MLKAQNEAEARLLANAPRFIERAIGRTMTVRSQKLPRNVKVTGTIISATPARFERNLLRVTLIFQVTIEAGLNKTKHVFHLRRLPQ
jgi:hypothetical protein